MSEQSLAIDAYKNRILEQLTSSHLVLAAATGTGKSTRMPVWATEVGRTLVVEPRRVACTSLYHYLKDCYQDKLSLGYSIRFDNCVSDDDQLVFVTPGVALKWFAENQLHNFDVVVIDEFHERRWDTDLLLAILKQSNTHRIAVTSASMNTQKVAQYLGVDAIEVAGKQFPVDLVNVASQMRQMPSYDHLVSRVTQVIEQAVDKHQGNILVFLPGKGEIQKVTQSLSCDECLVVPLYGGISVEDQQQALSPSKQRRIILATNVAETSVTVPGIEVVIDSGLERRTHQRNGRSVLGLHPISDASAIQRKGRAGRTAAGFCYRLYGETAPLEAVTPPEISREDLSAPMLMALCAGFKLQHLPLLEDIPEHRIESAVVALGQIGAVDKHGRLTEHGRAIHQLPIDHFFAHLLVSYDDPEYVGAICDLTAALSIGRSLYELPSSVFDQKDLDAWQPIKCDFVTSIFVIRSHQVQGVVVQTERLQEARHLSNQIRQVMGIGVGVKGDNTDINYQRIKSMIANAYPELVFVRRQRRQQSLSNSYIEVQQGRSSRLDESSVGALVFDFHSTPGKGNRQTNHYATCMSPLDDKLLANLNLGEWHVHSSCLQEDGVWVKKEKHYAGRVIHEVEAKAYGEELCLGVTKLILDQKMMPGLVQVVSDQLFAWELNSTLLGKTVSAASTEDWIYQRLMSLGVEHNEDLECISPEDLYFPNIELWQVEDILDKFPREIFLSDLFMKVNYDVNKKLVVVEKTSGKRKDDPKRWELPKWTGWRIKFKKASRIVDIR